jgi:hypothetical protein
MTTFSMPVIVENRRAPVKGKARHAAPSIGEATDADWIGSSPTSTMRDVADRRSILFLHPENTRPGIR